jgi:hypothetical protein
MWIHWITVGWYADSFSHWIFVIHVAGCCCCGCGCGCGGHIADTGSVMVVVGGGSGGGGGTVVVVRDKVRVQQTLKPLVTLSHMLCLLYVLHYI